MNWRQWRITRSAVGRAYSLGVISGSVSQGTETGWRVTHVYWRGERPYVLGLERERWGYPWHLIRHGHWPVDVGFGACGKCVPWPCCGATGWDHAEGCEDA